MRRDEFEAIEAATVCLSKLKGHGVLIPGGYILTAAHCIELDTQGGMVLGDWFTEYVNTLSFGRFRAAPVAVDPMSDIAVLGPPDDQTFPKDHDTYDTFSALVKPVPVYEGAVPVGEKMSVHVHGRHDGWVDGTVTASSHQRAVVVETERQIRFGASGGPIVTESGELVGVVSHSGLPVGTDSKWTGTVFRPHLCLPVWLAEQIR